MLKAVRGTRDLLPPETEIWNFVDAAARDVFRAYNFHEIRTPILEDLTLFQRSVGEETDIVAKEMFAWEDRPRYTTPAEAGKEITAALTEASSDAEKARAFLHAAKGQWLALRPENTAGVV